MAGLTSAIYGARASKSVLVLESKVAGGQILESRTVSNWPGSPEISGVDLMKEITEQAKKMADVSDGAIVGSAIIKIIEKYGTDSPRYVGEYVKYETAVDEEAYIRLAEIRSDIVDFVESHKNLYICSKYTGNGKTSWAIKMLHTYFHYTAGGNYDNLKGMFVSVADLLLKLKDFKNPVDKAYKDNLENVDLIVWDDIGLSNISQYDYTQLYTIINNRMFSGKSNIFTSNCTTQEKLLELVGDKLASRIWNTSEIIEFKGGDIR